MKATLVAGALAALVYGTTAGAQSEPAPQRPPAGGEVRGPGGEADAQQPRQDGEARQEPDFGVQDDFGYEQEGVGGAGEADGVDTEPGLPDQEPEEGQDIGGAGDVGQDVPEQAPLPPDMEAQDPQGVGGAGMPPEGLVDFDVQMVPVMPAPGVVRPQTRFTSLHAGLLRGTGLFGAQVATAPSPLFQPDALQAQDVTPQDVGIADFQVEELEQEDEAIGGAGLAEPAPTEGADMRGVTLLIGGGIEGYTGNLAPSVNPGGTAGVSASFRPSRVFGFEVGYSGALNEVDQDLVGEVRDGADIVRNGGQAALTLGLTATPIQPYVLGGVGVNFYNIRNGEAAGFQDDTVGTVPVGLGLRTHLGEFTADARLHYNFLFGQQFAPAVGNDDTAGSYTGTINLGGTF